MQRFVTLVWSREEQPSCQGGFSLTQGSSTPPPPSTVTSWAWLTPWTGPSPARACTPWTTPPGLRSSTTSTAWQSCSTTTDLYKLAKYIRRLTKNMVNYTRKKEKEVSRNKIVKLHIMFNTPILNLLQDVLKIIAKLTSRHVAVCSHWSLLESLVKRTNHSACRCSQASPAQVRVSAPPSSSTTRGTSSYQPTLWSSKIKLSNLVCFVF